MSGTSQHVGELRFSPKTGSILKNEFLLELKFTETSSMLPEYLWWNKNTVRTFNIWHYHTQPHPFPSSNSSPFPTSFPQQKDTVTEKAACFALFTRIVNFLRLLERQKHLESSWFYLRIYVFWIWGNINNMCSVAKSCLTLCDPMDCSTLSFPVLRYLLEFAQIHVRWVDDAIQPSLPPYSPFAFNLSQHQGLFQWVSSSHLK